MAKPRQLPASKHIEQKQEKKTFDKKKFLKDKFNKKNKVQQWEERRQKFALRKYHKELKKDKMFQNINNKKPSYDSEEDETREKRAPRLSSFKSVQLELQRRKEEQIKQREERIKKQNEIKEAIEKYKQKKAEKFKKLSKKTKRGQPVMKDRLELLFEEVKQKVGCES